MVYFGNYDKDEHDDDGGYDDADSDGYNDDGIHPKYLGRFYL